ncbi:DUF4365 domain-containing protein [Flavobacterium chungangensis]|uniref:DUF4365 domain-containing protein n=1 Tax=Flavobacterium chungangensis TaxID=2708132 RepID=A0ABV8ZK00_9FLAO
MIRLPQRISQHKSESDSFAILLYKLKNLGIFRNFTQNDYGIDLEVELLEDDNITGKYFKVQVKSSVDLVIRQDGIPTTNGIKQSTLNYWAELSFHSPVIAFAVDVKKENIYISKPLFWQALSLIDSSGKSKTIEYFEKDKTPEDTKELIDLITKFATQPSIHEQVFAHKQFLERFKQILDSYEDCVYSDLGSEITMGSGAFRTFLNATRTLLYEQTFDVKNKLAELLEIYSSNKKFHKIRDFNRNDIENIFDFQYYLDLSYHPGANVNGKDALMAFNLLFPIIGNRLTELRNVILKSESFWQRRDPQYLDLVTKALLPDHFTFEALEAYNKSFSGY